LKLNKADNWLCSKRVVRFGDTDAAGVMHFLQLFRWCHEAWEESLDRYGLLALDIFPSRNNDGMNPLIGLPIIHCKADFRVPITTGDNLDIKMIPEKLNVSSFQIITKFKCHDKDVASGLVRHLAIDLDTRERCALPEGISLWLEASSTT